MSTNGAMNSPTVQFLQALGGGVSGAITRAISQPFDVLKIRFQLQVEPLSSSQGTGSKYHGMLQAVNSIYAEEGIRGMWKGHLHGQIMSITYAVVQFWSYEQFRTLSKQYKFFADRPYFTYFLCGGIAGTLGAIVAQPFDVVRTRVVAADPNSVTSKLNPLTGIFTVLKTDGWRGASSGLLLTILQIYPLVGSNFVVYKSLNEIYALMYEYYSGKQTKHTIPGLMLFINGGLSGMFAKALIYPADVIKKRYMLSYFTKDRTSFGKNPDCATVKQCVLSTLRNEGFKGFYKGMWPTLIKSGVMSACYFTVYDYYNRIVTQPYKRAHEEETPKKFKRTKSSW